MAKKTDNKTDIRKQIKVETQLYRVSTDLLKYRNAVLSAESITNPQRYPLYQVYISCVLDAHLTSAIQQRKNLMLSKVFVVKDKAGKENEEKTAIIRKKWFRDYLDHVLDSNYWGHSLIQFDTLLDQSFKCVELVPRIYVCPELHLVKYNYSVNEGADYLDAPWDKWCLGVGKSHDLGLLQKAAPLVIWKKNALGAWAEYVEKFGTPIRIGKTAARDTDTTANMEKMLKNMGTAAWGLFDLDDEIELIESTRQDAFQVFDMMIQRCNSEISKLILGQTATLDEKSFVGSAEVHERVLKMVAAQDEFMVSGINNYQLVPLLISHGLLSDGDTIECEVEDAFTLEQKSKLDIELIKTGKFTFDPAYIKEKYGTEVIEVKEPVDTGLAKMKNSLEKYYS